MFKKVLALFTAAAISLTLGACGGEKSVSGKKAAVKTTLSIAYSSGHYGSEWINAIVREYKKENPGVEVKLNCNTQLDSQIGLIFETGSAAPDIAFVSNTNWQLWASRGYLTDLSGLSVGGSPLSSKLQQGLSGYCATGGKYWVIPFGDEVTGLLYNAEIFEKYGWKTPETVADLYKLIPEIIDKDISPFAWSTQNISFWNSAIYGWWAQYEGTAGISEYLKMASAQVYSQQGRLKALEIFQKLLEDSENSVADPDSIDTKKAVSLFQSGKAVMMPGGYLSELRTKYKLSDNTKIRMMKLPAIDGAKENGINCSAAGDIALIPAGASEPEAAKNFLSFMCSDAMLTLFTQKTGVPSPFSYDAQSVQQDSLFQSAASLWQSGKKIYMVSQNPVYYNQFFDWPYAGSPLLQIYMGNTTAKKAYEDNARYATDNWTKAAQKQSGLSSQK